jgi:hypothetical protein
MENPTNAELARQIETVAQTVAKIYEQMATKEETNSRFDAIEQRLDRIEKSHGYRLETLERDVAVLKA